MTDIEAIRVRVEAATPGPWVVPPAELYKNDTWHLWIATVDHPPNHPYSPKFIAWMTGGLGSGRTPREPDTDTAADAEFIAHAREDIPALLAEVDRLTAENERLKAAIFDIDAHATPLGEDEDGFVSVGYAVSVGSLHRALGIVGHSSARCGDLPCPRAAALSEENARLRAAMAKALDEWRRCSKDYWAALDALDALDPGVA